MRRDPGKILVQECKRIFENQAHPEEERHGRTTHDQYPRQELTVTVPFAQGDQRGERRHQPGPEQERAGLSTPPGRDLQIGWHAAACYFIDELYFVMIV